MTGNRRQLPSASAGAERSKDESAPCGYKRETCCSCGRRRKVLVREPALADGCALVTIRCGHCDRVEHKYAVHGYWWWRYLGHARREAQLLAEEHGFGRDEYGFWE
ncbi:MAG: hypothetical protein M3P51_00825 [Chloroflexota bacterium]|nr:hypothetical protein [Chloroflexota bacterium]